MHAHHAPGAVPGELLGAPLAWWGRLRDGLATIGAGAPPPPAEGRQGAALVLLHARDDADLGIVLTRRRDDLANHPGQISFPGGRVDPGETIEAAALREAAEEVDLDPASVEVLGQLPAFFIPPSRFWLSTVIARWRDPHLLAPAEHEVAEVLEARLSLLRDERTWRRVQMSERGAMWAWQLDEAHLLWGATAGVTAALLDVIAPGWHGGRRPQDLPAERDVRPWEGEPVAVRPRPARLAGIAEIPGTDVPVNSEATPPRAGQLAQVGDLLARAAAEMVGRAGPVVVLAGGGGTGAAGIATARLLAGQGLDVMVVLASDAVPGVAAGLAEGLAIAPFDASLPSGALYVDALLGRGAAGPVRGRVGAVVRALRGFAAPILSVELPTGLEPRTGLVGETVSADVTVALGELAPGLFAPGMVPFVGDLYVIHRGQLRRVVGAPGAGPADDPANGRWRE
jgi:NAD(P)H-hydrate repair Nnr-like enzyme with NAD(P)H-hydrate epimerase domain/8-oxo-dGTP pyrophosphatase MutT (NUDIX family)